MILRLDRLRLRGQNGATGEFQPGTAAGTLRARARRRAKRAAGQVA
ncbi:hypothetical protein BIWAKO_06137 [Bosea sp. BIWAKO-01]|nr:hypothetical protein BIWAKO_06137 [Bosea sp. BIWAKO-01]